MDNHLPECDRVWSSEFAEQPCAICAMLNWVREDQTKILNSRVMYQSGYTDGYRDALEAIRDATSKLINE